MNIKTKISICLFLLVCLSSFGQVDPNNYKRELSGVTDQWHKIILPNEIFGKLSPDFSDIRIMGITENNDTIEAPYILLLSKEKRMTKEEDFKTINKSRNKKTFYYTFELNTKRKINQIKLDFKQDNFDWHLKLEGSQNQTEWYTIVDDYRILSIKNEQTNYQFTTLSFPASKYHFFRIAINSKKKPKLTTAKISLNEIIDGNYVDYIISSTKIKENKKTKQTVIDIDFKLPIPLSFLKLNIKDDFDYYRSVTIKYLSDSIKTEKGWKYNYSTLTSGILNSIEKNEFRFNSTILQKLSIIIRNNDNQALSIGDIIAKGYVHEVVIRFSEPANYYLSYGNSKLTRPHYDIDKFNNKIPDTLKSLQLGKEMVIEKIEEMETEPLLKNKNLLWIVMTVVILLLGWFSVKMIRKG